MVSDRRVRPVIGSDATRVRDCVPPRGSYLPRPCESSDRIAIDISFTCSRTWECTHTGHKEAATHANSGRPTDSSSSPRARAGCIGRYQIAPTRTSPLVSRATECVRQLMLNLLRDTRSPIMHYVGYPAPGPERHLGTGLRGTAGPSCTTRRRTTTIHATSVADARIKTLGPLASALSH